MSRPPRGQVQAQGASAPVPHGQRGMPQERRGLHQVLPSGRHEGRHVLHLPPGGVHTQGRRVHRPARGDVQMLVRGHHPGAGRELLLRAVLQALGDPVEEQGADRPGHGPHGGRERQDRRHRGRVPPVLRQAEEGLQGPHLEAQEGRRVRVHRAGRQGRRRVRGRLPRRDLLLLPVHRRIRH